MQFYYPKNYFRKEAEILQKKYYSLNVSELVLCKHIQDSLEKYGRIEWSFIRKKLSTQHYINLAWAEIKKYNTIPSKKQMVEKYRLLLGTGWNRVQNVIRQEGNEKYNNPIICKLQYKYKWTKSSIQRGLYNMRGDYVVGDIHKKRITAKEIEHMSSVMKKYKSQVLYILGEFSMSYFTMRKTLKNNGTQWNGIFNIGEEQIQCIANANKERAESIEKINQEKYDRHIYETESVDAFLNEMRIHEELLYMVAKTMEETGTQIFCDGRIRKEVLPSLRTQILMSSKKEYCCA